ncbi:MAG: hypothetical protein ACE5EO_09615 [Candidatus Krumholzibacteriia bacterium]
MRIADFTEGLRELVHDAIDETTTTVQVIHQAIANAPLDVLQRTAAFEQPARELRETQVMLMSAVYDTLREINRDVRRLGDELLG